MTRVPSFLSSTFFAGCWSHAKREGNHEPPVDPSGSALPERLVFHRLIPPLLLSSTSTAPLPGILRKSTIVYLQGRGKTVVRTVSGPFVAVSRVNCTPGNGSEASDAAKVNETGSIVSRFCTEIQLPYV